jgi:hypothetical protein
VAGLVSRVVLPLAAAAFHSINQYDKTAFIPTVSLINLTEPAYRITARNRPLDQLLEII